MSKPTVAIIGRPNVGKSTFFNYVVGKRISIVEDTPGVTRDRVYADANWRGRNFILVDTGGIEPESDDVILSQMRRQADMAIEIADVILFITDIKQGVTAADHDIALMLKKSKKPIILICNKSDTFGKTPDELYEFYNLGIGDPYAVSSVNAKGIGDVLDAVYDNLPPQTEDEDDSDVIKVAIIGKPNVGKSSLVNKILGENRVIVSDIAGTTRDAIDSEFQNEFGKYVFIDTAGIRRKSKVNDKRLNFLLGEITEDVTFEDTLKHLIAYEETKHSNITIIDLSGVPFDVLSITVSLISRIIFEYGYFYKRLRCSKNGEERINNDVPILLVYEEAHKYVPNSDLAKYRSSKHSIERIAKEGRKYGVSLLLASQRPSEISETIFSQCNNFLAMRLTNPNDQNYVKRLLPDTLGNLIDKMPTLKAGECILIGESVILPSIVQIDRCSPEPSSNDIPYWKLWKEEWKDLKIDEIKKEWYK